MRLTRAPRQATSGCRSWRRASSCLRTTRPSSTSSAKRRAASSPRTSAGNARCAVSYRRCKLLHRQRQRLLSFVLCLLPSDVAEACACAAQLRAASAHLHARRTMTWLRPDCARSSSRRAHHRRAEQLRVRRAPAPPWTATGVPRCRSCAPRQRRPRPPPRVSTAAPQRRRPRTQARAVRRAAAALPSRSEPRQLGAPHLNHRRRAQAPALTQRTPQQLAGLRRFTRHAAAALAGRPRARQTRRCSARRNSTFAA